MTRRRLQFGISALEGELFRINRRLVDTSDTERENSEMENLGILNVPIPPSLLEAAVSCCYLV